MICKEKFPNKTNVIISLLLVHTIRRAVLSCVYVQKITHFQNFIMKIWYKLQKDLLV